LKIVELRPAKPAGPQQKDAGMAPPAQRPLPDLEPGDQGIVQTIDSGAAFVGRMAAMGLSPGARVTVTQNYPKRPLIVMVRNTFIALSRTEAGQIQVGQNQKPGKREGGKARIK